MGATTSQNLTGKTWQRNEGLMNSDEFENGFRQLDSLAQKEYHVPLAEVALGPEDEEKRLLRLGRLIGVVLKQPFAVENDLATPSEYRRAYRSWELDSAALEDPSIRGSWQYKALETLRTDPDVISALGWQPLDVYDLAQTAHHERCFFSFLAVSCRKYLCRDQKLRREIEREVKSARNVGFNVKNITPEMMVASGGLTIGTLLVQAIPVLGIMGAPVIAGIVFIIYSIGIDAFCSGRLTGLCGSTTPSGRSMKRRRGKPGDEREHGEEAWGRTAGLRDN